MLLTVDGECRPGVGVAWRPLSEASSAGLITEWEIVSPSQWRPGRSVRIRPKVRASDDAIVSAFSSTSVRL